jgi:hypothetical protein
MDKMTAKGVTTRDEFEEWTRLDDWDWDLTRKGYSYENPYTTCAWRAWEARSFGATSRTYPDEEQRRLFNTLRAGMINAEWKGEKS